MSDEKHLPDGMVWCVVKFDHVLDIFVREKLFLSRTAAEAFIAEQTDNHLCCRIVDCANVEMLEKQWIEKRVAESPAAFSAMAMAFEARSV